MELSSHVVTNLDQWVENGLINAQQREAIAQLMQDATQDAYWAGQDSMDTYDDGFDEGYDVGYAAAKTELEEKMRDEWFEQGWAEALLEHGIEE